MLHPLDVERQLQQHSARLIPAGGPGGQYLVKTSANDYEVGWGAGPAAEIARFHGDPNGAVGGYPGQLGVDIDSLAIWMNQDGNTNWTIFSGSGGDSLWEVLTSGSRKTLTPLQSMVEVMGGTDDINSFEVEFEHAQSGGDVHHTYFYVDPGVGAGGGDVQAETLVVGKDAVMDWFFWSRHRSGTSYEAGTFFDAIGDDGSGGQPEAYFETYADGSGSDVELFVDTDATASCELDLIADVSDDVAYIYLLGGHGTNFLYFGKLGGTSNTPFQIAPDAQLPLHGDSSIGFDSTTGNLIVKLNDGGTIKTAIMATPV